MNFMEFFEFYKIQLNLDFEFSEFHKIQKIP